ncbi:hypothetical protein Gotri_020453 [Gossypium trilobum]|uniref:Uncharacterized protein n=1 Tax=Gossypium trilobum TaxID=34281 RepID=A0A7J9D9F2_9ROSI|nr:hypothetical protein [Gossypium trilobum]
MKKATINSVYGARGRKRCKDRVEESRNSSKSASMTDKGRTNGVRATKALSTIPNNRTIEPQPQPPANEVAVVDNKGEGVEELTLDDWPITFRFDEEWPWSKVRYDSGWYSCWETMNGDFWTPVRDHSQESVWSGDLWEFKP